MKSRGVEPLAPGTVTDVAISIGSGHVKRTAWSRGNLICGDGVALHVVDCQLFVAGCQHGEASGRRSKAGSSLECGSGHTASPFRPIAGAVQCIAVGPMASEVNCDSL